MSGLVQLVSDIHCDVAMRPISIRPTAVTLVVAGDVAPFVHPRYRDYMAAITANHRNVAYVPGNHEFYDSNRDPDGQAISYMENVCRSLPSNVVLLRKGGDHLDVPGTAARIVGATMWTNIDKHLMGTLGNLLNDFSHISYGGSPLEPSGMNRLHAQDKEWVRRSIASARRAGKRAVVVTHHSPDRRLSIFNSEKAKNGFGPLYYSSDMGDLITNPNVAAWLYGHTHESHVLRLPESPFPFVTNAKGYPGQETGWVESFAMNFSSRR